MRETYSFRLQERAKAREFKDQQKALGHNAWMTMDLGATRYGGTITVHVETAEPLRIPHARND